MRKIYANDLIKAFEALDRMSGQYAESFTNNEKIVQGLTMDYVTEELLALPYTLHLQVDGLTLKNIALKAAKENKSIENFISDCIEKGLKDE